MLGRLVNIQAEAGRLVNAHRALAIGIEPTTCAVFYATTDVVLNELDEAPVERVSAMVDAMTLVTRSLRWSLTLATKRRFAS